MEQRCRDTDPMEMSRLRERWIDLLTARDVELPDDADMALAVSRLDSDVSKLMQLTVRGSDRLQVFRDTKISKDADMVTVYKRLAQMATAWATPSSIHYSCPSLLAIIVNGLDDGHRLAYNSQSQESGNWWSWEIGVPKALANTMSIVVVALSSDQINNYCASIDHFIPDPTLQFSDARGKRISEGANRVDICQAIIVRSIVGLEASRLRAAVSALSPVWQYVSEGNGFHRDGSLIQHSTIPYTGTYGVVLLSGLAKLFSLLSNSKFAIEDPSKDFVNDAVENCFAPFMHDGEILDSVRGRAVSRMNERGLDNGAYAIEAILQLANTVGKPRARHWYSLCRGWIERNSVRSPLITASVPRTALIKELMSLPVPPAAEVQGHFFFPAMDRSVYHSAGWVVALSLSSRRIASFESGNGENNNGIHIGSGMTSLYASDAAHFDDNFWPTADLSRLPGITIDVSPLPASTNREWGTNTIQNDWTGGASLGTVGAVGMHLLAPGEVDMEARKSWFFFDEMVVALGAGIRSTSGNLIETIIEHRNTGSRVGNLTVDGRLQSPKPSIVQRHDAPRWAHLDGVAGYLFLQDSAISVLQEKRVGSWSQVNRLGHPAPIEREYTTIIADHGISPSNSGYAYALLPNASRERTGSLANHNGLVVMRNDSYAQGVSLHGCNALNFWTATCIGSISSSAAACVIMQRRDDGMGMVIADPTQTAKTVTITISGENYSKCSSQGKVSLDFGMNGDIRITVRTEGLDGQGVEVALAP